MKNILLVGVGIAVLLGAAQQEPTGEPAPGVKVGQVVDLFGWECGWEGNEPALPWQEGSPPKPTWHSWQIVEVRGKWVRVRRKHTYTGELRGWTRLWVNFEEVESYDIHSPDPSDPDFGNRDTDK